MSTVYELNLELNETDVETIKLYNPKIDAGKIGLIVRDDFGQELLVYPPNAVLTTDNKLFVIELNGDLDGYEIEVYVVK